MKVLLILASVQEKIQFKRYLLPKAGGTCIFYWQTLDFVVNISCTLLSSG